MTTRTNYILSDARTYKQDYSLAVICFISGILTGMIFGGICMVLS